MANRSEFLGALDDVLFSARRMVQHRSYRKRLLHGISHDVELATLRLLSAVQRVEDPPSIGEIAESLAIDPSTASRLVDRAVASGYLARFPETEDRRRIRLQLTTAGDEVLSELNDRRREILAESTQGWQDEELERLALMLSRLVEDFRHLELTK